MSETRGDERPETQTADVPAARETRCYPSRPIVGVGGVILVPRDDGTGAGGPGVVLIKRRFEPMAGCWNIPGGVLEVGETLQEGAARELREETGLEVQVGPVVEVFDRITRDASGRVVYHYVLVDFVCWPVGGSLTASSDASAVEVADPAALDRYALSPKTAEVIARALAMRPGLPSSHGLLF